MLLADLHLVVALSLTGGEAAIACCGNITEVGNHLVDEGVVQNHAMGARPLAGTMSLTALAGDYHNKHLARALAEAGQHL